MDSLLNNHPGRARLLPSPRIRDSWHKIVANLKDVTAHIGDFQARLLLTLFYFTILVAFSLIAKLIDPLVGRRRAAASGWERRALVHDDITRAGRQF